MILIVTGGRDYTMQPADWLRLDALHFRDVLPDEARARRHQLVVLRALQPWTLLVCWCHATKPCHGMVVADAAQQLRAADELRASGRALPARHWSNYRGEKETAKWAT